MLLVIFLFVCSLYRSQSYSEIEAIFSETVSRDLKDLRYNGSGAVNVSSPKRKTIVTFVNGIYHSTEEWKRISDNLLEIFSKACTDQTSQMNSRHLESILQFEVEVRPFYNPSTGWWLADLTQAATTLIKRPSDLSTALGLAEHLRSCLASLNDINGRILHLAHSGGAIVTYLAAKYHLSADERNRIDVVTFGGGRSITRKYFSGRVVNYYARNDPLLLVDQRAGQLAKSLSPDNISAAICSTVTLNNRSSWADAPVSLWERVHAKYNTSFVYIRGILNHPVNDHSMEGPTYYVALRREADALR